MGRLERGVPLAPFTTFGLGGSAAFWADEVSADDLPAVASAIVGATGAPPLILGDGSNLLVADGAIARGVIRLGGRGLTFGPSWGSAADVIVDAGTPWDHFVAQTVEAGLQGVECLSGIPGRVGAAPIQNIGAYGQEVSDTVVAVEGLDLRSGDMVSLAASECAFGYRTSRFKLGDGTFVVTRVHFRLHTEAPPTVTYRDVAQALLAVREPTLPMVRDCVLAIRRQKSMVVDASDPNHRSAGSFFTNPVVSVGHADALAAEHGATFPRYASASGVKLSAAWLIEHAGITRGFVLGPARVSTRHTLALTAASPDCRSHDIVRLAALIRRAVRRRFDITLEPEPIFVGYDQPAATVLDEAEESLQNG
ncbi:MAG: UDP-N-acetylmuramate dehydrogenase [Myxococcales bacterium]|nr:UDP-N-acetylmuramate dehydrogenase [Myxococcales bacterium]